MENLKGITQENIRNFINNDVTIHEILELYSQCHNIEINGNILPFYDGASEFDNFIDLSKELKTRLEEYNMKTRQSYNIQDPYGVIEFGDILNTVFKMMASIVYKDKIHIPANILLELFYKPFNINAVRRSEFGRRLSIFPVVSYYTGQIFNLHISNEYVYQFDEDNKAIRLASLAHLINALIDYKISYIKDCSIIKSMEQPDYLSLAEIANGFSISLYNELSKEGN